MPIRVFVIEDQREIRDGLAVLIGGTPGFSCAGAHSTMESALSAMKKDLPDVALVDLDLPGMSGIDGVRLLRERFPSVSPLVLTIHDENEHIIEALCNGANGYLLKSTPPARLLDSIRESATGGSPMSPEIARQVVHLFRKFQPPAQSDYQLTPHETRILKLLAEGENYKSIGVVLGVTINTVSYHIRHIYEKLHVHSRSEAVAKALRGGLLH